jgi:hypothetical protein
VHTHMTNTRITDVEILERRFPILVPHPRHPTPRAPPGLPPDREAARAPAQQRAGRRA